MRAKGYLVTDQTIRGKSANKKQLGELDFEIMKTPMITFAIYEALNLKGFSDGAKQYLTNHMIKLLDNYSPMGVSIVFLVSYMACEIEKFNNYWLSYRNYLQHYSVSKFVVRFVREHEQIENYLRCMECSYECEGSRITMYHIVVRMDG